jgi:hypothetical protein
MLIEQLFPTSQMLDYRGTTHAIFRDSYHVVTLLLVSLNAQLHQDNQRNDSRRL